MIFTVIEYCFSRRQTSIDSGMCTSFSFKMLFKFIYQWDSDLFYRETQSSKLCEIVGIGNWENRYSRDEKGILFCTITISFERKDGVVGTISKTDCGTESNVEQQKGEVSDAFKRCAVNFGIARDLYNLPDPKGFKYVAEMKGNKLLNPNTNSFVVVQQWKPKEDK